MSVSHLPDVPRPAGDPADPPAALSYGPALRDAILASFSGGLRPVAVPWSYRLGLLVVAAVMVLLPLVYLALIVMAGFGAVWWATHGLAVIGEMRGRLRMLLYVGPLVVLAAVVLFMIKPLFAPRRERPHMRSLQRNEEPLLFALVERVAEVVGASAPRRIDVDCRVNASASFRLGAWSMFGDDLVLTLGLPLVGGLTLAQLAGVVAHELGHFAQGTAMRLSYVIRSVNLWFHRVVYERDGWDESLDREFDRAKGMALPVLWLSRVMIRLTRRILRGLMWIGQVVSCFLLREMEYDADRYHTRLVGPAVFAGTHLEMWSLGNAYGHSLSLLAGTWAEQKLCRSLPDLVQVNRRRLGQQLEAAAREALAAGVTGRFDTHPSGRDRIANARRENDPPVFRSDLPATVLFRDFPGLAAAVSLDLYRQVLGDGISPRQLVDVGEAVAEGDQGAAERQAGVRYWLGLAMPLRPLPIPAAATAAAPEALIESMRQARLELAPARQEIRSVVAAYCRADTDWITGLQASAMRGVGLRELPQELVTAYPAGARQRMEELGARLEPWERSAGRRLAAAMSLLADPARRAGLPGAEEWHAEIPRLLAAGHALAGSLGRLIALRNARAELEAVAHVARTGGDETPIAEVGERVLGALDGEIVAVRRELLGVEHPFPHRGGPANLAAAVVPRRPDVHDPSGLHALGGEVLNRAWELWLRILHRLAWMAEQAELAAGLDPLAEPEEIPDVRAASG